MKQDVVVVGGGHNALVAAALLARRGLKPLVLERRAQVGGAAVTEEFHPGFRVSAVAHAAGPLRASLVAELGLRELGLELIEPEPRLFAPLADGRGLRLWGNAERSAAEIHRIWPRDAEAWPGFQRSLSAVSALVARALDTTPPDLDQTRRADLMALLPLGLGFRRLPRADAYRLLRWLTMPVADFASEWFESGIVQAVIAARGIFGLFAGPWSAGTTAHFLLQAAAQGGNAAGSAVLVRGGLGALAQALAEAARRAGAEVRTGAQVERILVDDGRVSGVALAGGETIAARTVVSATDPRRTFLDLLDPALLDPEDLWRVRHYRQQGMMSKVNLALSGLPAFTAVGSEDPAALLGGRIHIGPEIDDLERAFDEAKYGGISSRPYLDVTLPTVTDPSLAPRGAHVLSACVQYTPARLANGGWAGRREEVAEAVLQTLEVYAPGIRGLVVARQVLTPLDLEETYGLTGGHPFHGDHTLDQLFVSRPLLGWARYRGPIEGLYLCGAGTHPGGGVTGGPGANAAREILRDLA